MLAKTQVKTGVNCRFPLGSCKVVKTRRQWNLSQPSRHLWPRWSLSQWFDTSVPSAQGIIMGHGSGTLFDSSAPEPVLGGHSKKRNLCNQGLPGLCKLESDVCFQPCCTILRVKIPCRNYYFEPHFIDITQVPNASKVSLQQQAWSECSMRTNKILYVVTWRFPAICKRWTHHFFKLFETPWNPRPSLIEWPSTVSAALKINPASCLQPIRRIKAMTRWCQAQCLRQKGLRIQVLEISSQKRSPATGIEMKVFLWEVGLW